MCGSLGSWMRTACRDEPPEAMLAHMVVKALSNGTRLCGGKIMTTVYSLDCLETWFVELPQMSRQS